MKYGVSGAPLPAGLDYGSEVSAAASANGFAPCWIYAHAWQETIKVDGMDAASAVSDDGGHGLLQLTSSYPSNWEDPQANAAYAITNYLEPAIAYWNGVRGIEGDALVKCVAAEYNAGRTNAINGYNEGDVGTYTTHTDGVSYADLVLKYYQQLSSGQPPSG
jgi:hypothetical protein